MPPAAGIQSSNSSSRQRHTGSGQQAVDIDDVANENTSVQAQAEGESNPSAETVKWTVGQNEGSAGASANPIGDGEPNDTYFSDEIIPIPDRDSIVSI